MKNKDWAEWKDCMEVKRGKLKEDQRRMWMKNIPKIEEDVLQMVNYKVRM